MLLYFVELCNLGVHYTIVLNTPSFRFFICTISQVFLVNPEMMSELILLCHTDLHPVNFFPSASVPQNPSYEHRYSFGRSIQSHQLGWICESTSSRSHTDLPLSMSILLYCKSHLKKAEATWHHLGITFLEHLHFSYIYYLITNSSICVVISWCFREHSQIINTSACLLFYFHLNFISSWYIFVLSLCKFSPTKVLQGYIWRIDSITLHEWMY